MSSPNKSDTKGKDKQDLFPIGVKGRRELRNELKATKDPARTIQDFQESHSLHTMMAKAFGTVPSQKFKNTRSTADTKESLDTDSVMTFLSHLGVSQHEVHKRISDTMLKQLGEEIRKTNNEEPLLNLLRSCWTYATTIPELRPVLWAVLKQLGPRTPLAVLLALSERAETAAGHGGGRDDDGSTSSNKLKHAEIFQQIPKSLKQLCWEADWDQRLPPAEAGAASFPDSEQFLEQVKPTLLFETIEPYIKEYTTNAPLQALADRPFVATLSERRLLTNQRRALSKMNTATSAAGSTNKLTATTATTATTNHLTSGKAISHLRVCLCDKSYRPKLLYATLSVLIAQHGSTEKCFLGGSQHLHCTLVSDLLLSAGGPLPKAYTDVLTLARVLDEAVQEGNLTDPNLSKVQAALRLIFQPDLSDAATTPQKKKKQDASMTTTPEPDAPTAAVKRQLNRLISSGLSAMKDADPQKLFWNPVTDAIAPGYSKIIKKPMCISTMEQKVSSNAYNSVTDWEVDVKLMYKNCIDYNRGESGQWFRGEANRQGKVFREEIFPQARRMYHNEIAKRVVLADDTTVAGDKRKEGQHDISPLAPVAKKRKKEKEDYLPSMPALAAMMLCDPFVVRIILARVLREIRRGVLQGTTLPLAHSVVPSLLQLLHVARWSKQICSVRGKRYFVPGAGLEESEDPTAIVSHASLRRYLPLLLRLLIEAELDRRVAPGGDLHLASQKTSSLQWPPINEHVFDGSDQVQVAVALVEGAMVQICQQNLSSLSVSFPKFSLALQRTSVSLLGDRPFFICLIKALVRHRAKLSRATRDSVVAAWLQWLKRDRAMASAGHEYFVELLNEWSALGNVVLPRDSLVKFSVQAVEAVNSSEKLSSRKFANVWNSDAESFAPVKKQYERMLSHLPESSATQWKESVDIDQEETRTKIEPEKMILENSEKEIAPENN